MLFLSVFAKSISELCVREMSIQLYNVDSLDKSVSIKKRNQSKVHIK